MRVGDRAATPAEVAAWQAAQAASRPPTTLQIVSTGTPALNGTYAIDAGTLARLAEIVEGLQVTGAFPDGLSALPWPDASGAMHDFPTTASFIAFAEAVENYVVASNLGQTPATPVTMA